MNEKFRKRIRRRSSQYVRLLVARPDFQQHIASIRKKWQIPPQGFKARKAKSWHEWLRRIDNQFCDEEWSKVSARVTKLLKAKKYDEVRSLLESFSYSGPSYEFEWDVLQLMRETGVLPLWDRWTRGYVLYNNPSMNADVPNVLIARPLDFIKERDEVLLRVQKNTTLADVGASWELITFWQEGLKSRVPDKAQPYKNLDRDLEIYQLKQQGMKHQEIAELINDRYGTNLIYSQVGTIVRNIRKQLG